MLKDYLYELPQQGQQYLEGMATSPTGIAGAYRYWGVPRSDEIVRASGFRHVFQTPGGISLKEAAEIEVEMTKATISQSVALKGWDTKDVQALIVATGSPPIYESPNYDANYAQFIAHSLGMENIPVYNVWAGCSSGSIGLIHALERFSNSRVVVGAFEGMTRRAPLGELPDAADQFSRAVFTNAGSAIALSPHDIQLVSSSFSEIRDTTALRAIMTYGPYIPDIFGPSTPGSIVHSNDEYFAIDLAEPPHPFSIAMHPGETARFFIRHGGKAMEQYAGRHYDHLVIHHPSRRVLDALIERANKYGITFSHSPIFDIHNGNSSASTTNIHFIRQLEEMYEGDTALWFGFGAGATFVSAELQIK